MRVFMLGWEFPPYISGGLGTACHGLTKALSGLGVDVIFVMPRPIPAPSANPPPSAAHQQSEPAEQSIPLDALAPADMPTPAAADPKSATDFEYYFDEFEHVTFRTVKVQITDPYQTPREFEQQEIHREQMRVLRARIRDSRQSESSQTENAPQQPGGTAPASDHVPPPSLAPGREPPPPAEPQYGADLFAEVERYAAAAADLSHREFFDVVHAHDWMTFPAGMAVAAARSVPLIVHVHSTEFDRSGPQIDRRIYDIERRGMNAALKIIAVSALTKNQIIHNYGIDPDKIEIVYNGIETVSRDFDPETFKIHSDEKVVLFLGRITHQKGPEYFLAAAKKVLAVMDNVKFLMAGSGDLSRQTVEMASNMGIGHKVLFTGFLRGRDVDRVFKLADLYVMPSVSEPFGIAPLEAMSRDVPVIISKQSGVSEVLQHALKVDFWDTTEMANKIVAVLKHPPLARTLSQHGSIEVSHLNWTDAAEECLEVYEEVLELAEVAPPSRLITTGRDIASSAPSAKTTAE